MAIRSLVFSALVSVILVPAAHAQSAWTTFQERVIDSKVLGEARGIRVWTPPAYDATDQRYPVLYLTDAEGQFFHTASTVEFLARQGRMPPMIVIGVTNTDRTRDLTPTRGTIRGSGAPVFPTSGGADAFLTFFEKELVPWVEKTYRTHPFRVFAGHSFGGLFATHAFLSRPELFNAVIAVSPTLRWDDDLPLRNARAFVAARAGQTLKRAFLFTIGNEGAENDRAVAELETILGGHRLNGFRWRAWRFADDDHGSVVLPSHQAALREVFASWRLPTDADGTYQGTLADVITHYARLSDWMGYRVEAPEATVNVIGYQRLAQKRMEAALEFFRFNVKTYPDSANVHDSLGEGLEAGGDLDGARAAYQKAVARGEQTKDPLLATFKEHLERVKGGRGTGSAARR